MPAILARKPLGIAGARFGGLFRAIFRWRIRFKRDEKSSGGRGYFLNGCQKRCFIGFRWLVKTTHFTHKLQCGQMDLFFGHRWLKVEEGFDISTHTRHLSMLELPGAYLQ